MSLKALIPLSFLFLVNNLYGQLASPIAVSTAQLNNVELSDESPEKWARESYGEWDPSKEEVSLRDQNAKHFKNEDGTYTAIIAAGNLHYWENNRWNTIFHSIDPSTNGFRNLTNSHKTYYPNIASNPLTTVLPGGNQMKDMMGMRMYFEVNGQENISQNIIGSTGTVDFNVLTYPNVYGLGIDLRLTQETTKRKMDYIISSINALGSIPSQASYLVFEEKVELPAGWLAVLEGNVILVKDISGSVKAVYEKPMFKDAPQPDAEGHSHSDEAEGAYTISQSGNILTIKTKVQLDWLMDPERAFPVVIDPTVNLYPNNTAWWTGHYDAYHNSTDVSADAPLYSSSTYFDDFDDYIYVGRHSTYYPEYGWVKFNISSLPNSCVNSANLNYRVYYDFSNSSSCLVNARLRHLANDPVVTTGNTLLNDIRDGNIYATRDMRCFVTGTGWVSAPLTSNISDIETSIPSGTFSMGFHTFQGGAHTSCYTGIYGYSSANRPYLAVTYTPHYQVTFSSPTPTTFCAGQTQNVSVTVTNSGCMPWTSGGSTPNNVNFSWWGSWQSGQDANPRQNPFAGLAPGASQVVTFSVTAPSTPGSYSIQTDLVRELQCWFRGNAAPTCGPGNIDYIIPITVNPVLTVNAGSDATYCVGGSTLLNGSASPPSISTTNSYAGSGITINSAGNANPYPRTLNVSGLSGTITNIRIMINNLSHTYPSDIDMVLFGPTGAHSIIFNDAIGAGSISNRNYTFQIGATALPGSGPPASGTYGVVNLGGYGGTGTPSGVSSANLSNFIGTNPNGIWSLYVFDDASGDAGSIGSWSVEITTLEPASVTYLWSPATGLSSTIIPNPMASPASTTIYTLTATSLGCSNTDQVTVTVNPVASAPTSVSATHPLHPAYCHGNTINLTSVGGTAAGGGVVDVWYENSCNNIVNETWATTPVGRPGWGIAGTTVNSANGILNVTSTNSDPHIYLGNLSINPNVYRYVQVRYRYVSGPTNPGMQVFFENGSGLAEARSQRGTMIMDGAWHYLNLDMSVNYSGVNSGWVGGPTVTGLRFDFCENTGMVMEFDFLLVSQDRMVGDQTTLNIPPSSPYYPTVSTQYYTRKIDNCGASTCASTNVNLPPLGTTLALDNEAATCYVNANETIRYYHSSGRYIASVTAAGTTLGSTIATAYVEPNYLIVPACDMPSLALAVMNRHWVITPTTNGPATVRLPYYTSELADLGAGSIVSSSPYDLIVSPNNSNVLLSKYSGGAFPATTNVNDNPYDNCTVGGTLLYNNVAVGSTLPVASINAMYSDFTIPGFSEFWLHGASNNSPLPITLTSFAAICDDSGDEVKVQWTTASENNTSHFEVERSVDGTNWEVLGTAAAAGISTVSLTYELTDTDVRGHEVIYYRLNQFDQDGESESFGMATAECLSDLNGFELFPNPAGTEVTILLNGSDFSEGNTSIVFSDLNGKELERIEYKESVGKLMNVDLRSFETGVYLVRLINGDENTQFIRLIKQ